MHFESGLLNVEAMGAFSLDEAKRAFLEMLGAVAHYQAKKVLLDGRTVRIDFNVHKYIERRGNMGS